MFFISPIDGDKGRVIILCIVIGLVHVVIGCKKTRWLIQAKGL
jgi:hypothetical protein